MKIVAGREKKERNFWRSGGGLSGEGLSGGGLSGGGLSGKIQYGVKPDIFKITDTSIPSRS